MPLIQKLISIIKSKRLNAFFAFIVLALMYSILTKLSENFTKTFSFQVNPVNVPENVVILNDSASIDLAISTFGFKQIKYYFSNPTIDIDFENLKRTKDHYYWVGLNQISSIREQFDVNTEVTSFFPDSLFFGYDVSAVKKVPVVVNADIAFSSGFDLKTNYSTTPDSVKVIGPKVVIDTIQAIETQKLSLQNINDNIHKRLKLHLTASDQLKYSHDDVLIEAEVEKFTEGSVEIPISIINAPNGKSINFYPKSVPVIFYTSLTHFKEINSNSFVVECDYNSIKDGTTYLIPKIVKQPEYVKYSRLNVNRVEFILMR